MGKRILGEQVVVITGASYGLGRAIAREAARGGAKVVAAVLLPRRLGRTG